jgi:bifunctional non-homologous end joining protein LigD
LIWVANLADLELHTFLHRKPKIDRPDAVVFDLDPGPPATIVECCRVGLMLRELLEKRGLQSLAKTSGSKGLQMHVPLNTPVTYDQTKPFALGLAEQLRDKEPGLIVAKMQKSLRRGKVFIDWSQNDEHKTTVSAYSLRAKARPTVSTPVTWEEVARTAEKGDPEALVFDSNQALARVAKLGDLYAPVLSIKQRLPKLAV